MAVPEKGALVESGRTRQSVLISIIRGALHGTADGKIDPDKLVADWDILLHLAAKQGVAPLVWNYLLTSGQDLSPQHSLRLRRMQAMLGLRNRALTKELAAVSSGLRNAGVSCLSFKGPVLAHLAYGDTGRRQFGDLDLFAAKERHVQILEMLEAAGFVIGERYPFETSLCHAQRPVSIDVHWDFAQPRLGVRLGFEDLWSRRQTVTLEGEPVATFCAEDTILALCIHAAKDFCGDAREYCAGRLRLLNLVDIAKMIRATPGLDAERLGRIARQARVCRMLTFGLFATAEVLEEPGMLILAKGLGLAPDFEVRRAIRQVSNQFLHGSTGTRSRIVFLGAEHLPEKLWRLGIFVDGCIRLWNCLSTPSARDRQFIPLPESLSWLHYLVRPIRLASDTIRRPLEIWRSLLRTTTRSFLRLKPGTAPPVGRERSPAGLPSESS